MKTLGTFLESLLIEAEKILDASWTRMKSLRCVYASHVELPV